MKSYKTTLVGAGLAVLMALQPIMEGTGYHLNKETIEINCDLSDIESSLENYYWAYKNGYYNYNFHDNENDYINIYRKIDKPKNNYGHNSNYFNNSLQKIISFSINYI